MEKYECMIQKRLTIFKEILEDKELMKQFEDIAAVVKSTLRLENKILVCGNGGSAADAIHFSGELVGRFKKERRPFPVIALNTDLASITAIANDYSYEEIFSRQVEAFANKGDLVLAITTSGNSINVVKALEYANQHNITTCGLIGKDGGKAKGLLKYPVHIKVSDTELVQEVQQILVHMLCSEVDDDYE